MKALLASGNRGKLRELQSIFGNTGLDLATCTEEGIILPNTGETGKSYLENARLKAEALAKVSGLPALADDSGLEVDALGGAPGIFSARFSGAGATDSANINRLLGDLAGITRRTARFRCVLVVAWPGGGFDSAEGTLEGEIAQEPRGTGGFGYDPVFVLPDGRHVAELTQGEKDRISHRAKAARNLAELLEKAGKIRP